MMERFEIDDEEEYYEDGSELFSEDLSNIIGMIEDDIQPDLDLSDAKDKALYDRLEEVKKDKKVLQELKDFCIDKVNESERIINYISDYSISELGDMDGIWNEFGDILREAIIEYLG